MGTITISISDEIERKLREFVKKRGGGKGVMSKIIEEALKLYFSRLEEVETTFKAFKDNILIAEAKTLEELAEMLKEKNLDPRSVVIVSSKSIKPVVRRGWR